MGLSNTAFRRAVVPRAIAVSVAMALAACALAPPAPAEAAAAAAADSASYLVFHVDGIASSTFFELYDAGALPNIHELFAGGAVIRNAISPFVPGTEMIYGRMKTGSDASSSDHPISWRTISSETGEWLAYFQNLWGLWRWVPPYAVSQSLNGVPGLCDIAGLSALNIGRVLRDHSVVEFLWFGTDGIGHYWGIDGQKAGLVRFDAYLRPVVDYLRAHPGSLNVVLYADHGMSMIDEYVETEQVMSDVAGDDALLVSYPNIYLNEPQLARSVAYTLGNSHDIDWAFFREGEGRIVGYWAKGTMTLDYDDGGIAYSWQGADAFEYGGIGYEGQRLSDKEWLRLTAGLKYPVAPVQVVRYMENEFSGDVVVVVNAPKGVRGSGFIARHRGVIDVDCTVPVLLAGPDIDVGNVPEQIYLTELYTGVLGIDAINARVGLRESNSMLVSADAMRLRLSPSPSLCFVAEAQPLEGTGLVLGELSVFRSFNMRVWAGAGVSIGPFDPAVSLRVELFVGNLAMEHRRVASPAGIERRLRAEYQSQNGFTLFWEFPASLGMGFTW